jgi:hypothetical protein
MSSSRLRHLRQVHRRTVKGELGVTLAETEQSAFSNRPKTRGDIGAAVDKSMD